MGKKLVVALASACLAVVLVELMLRLFGNPARHVRFAVGPWSSFDWVAREERIPVADAVAAFAAHQGQALFGRYDLVHANPAGAGLIAETVYERLLALGWLETDASPGAGASPSDGRTAVSR